MNNLSATLLRASKIAGFAKLLILTLAACLLASPAVADARAELMQTTENNSAAMIAVLRENQVLYAENPEAFYQALADAVVEYVDVRRFAGRVMGKYGRDASETQKVAFINTFQDSLFQTYGKALADTGEFSLQVIDAEINPRRTERAIVNLEVTSETGQKYPLTYAMYLNPDKGWLVENVVVSGVNIGLAFRERFEQEMSLRNNDLDAVIANWHKTIEAQALEAEGV